MMMPLGPSLRVAGVNCLFPLFVASLVVEIEMAVIAKPQLSLASSKLYILHL